MNAPKSGKARRRNSKAPKIRPNQIVQLQVEQRDGGKGACWWRRERAGKRSRRWENLRGWWIVYYEALMLHWPTRAEDLRPAPAESPAASMQTV